MSQNRRFCATISRILQNLATNNLNYLSFTSPTSFGPIGVFLRDPQNGQHRQNPCTLRTLRKCGNVYFGQKSLHPFLERKKAIHSCSSGHDTHCVQLLDVLWAVLGCILNTSNYMPFMDLMENPLSETRDPHMSH